MKQHTHTHILWRLHENKGFLFYHSDATPLRLQKTMKQRFSVCKENDSGVSWYIHIYTHIHPNTCMYGVSWNLLLNVPNISQEIQATPKCWSRCVFEEISSCLWGEPGMGVVAKWCAHGEVHVWGIASSLLSIYLTFSDLLVRESPLFQGNLGCWNIIIWPDLCIHVWTFTYDAQGSVGMFFFPSSLETVAHKWLMVW